MMKNKAQMQEFGKRVKGYLRKKRLTLQRFALDVPLDYSTLSKFLNGGYSTPQAETHIRHIVMALAQKDILKNQGEAKELLDLAGCPYFSASEWKSPPLNKLGPLPPSISQEQAQMQRATTIHITAGQVRVVIDETRVSPTSAAEASLFTFMVPPPPTVFVPRPQEYEALKQVLLQQPDCSTSTTAVAEGTGGYGKTTLALKLCYDRDIWKIFYDGICFVSLGKKPVDLLGILNDLITYISKKHSNFSSLDAATAWLHDLLTDRSLLLVIDDVWHTSDLIPFLQGGPRCAHLITTRIHSIIPIEATFVRIDEMRREEALQLLCQEIDFSSESSINVYKLERLLTILIKDMGNWPLLLALANSTLRERINYLGQTLSEALLVLQKALKKQGIVAFDENDDPVRYTAVSACLEASLELLSRQEEQLFLDLAVFPENASIPLQTVYDFWKKTADLEQWEAEKLCLRLYRLSLLRVLDHKAQIIQIHDVIRGYLLSKRETDHSALHERLLDTYNVTQWADLSLEEPYLWKYLVWHLICAKRINQLLETVKDLNYIAAKAFSIGVSAAEIDLITAIEYAPNDSFLRILARRLAHIGHILNLGENLREVQNILFNQFQFEDILFQQSVAIKKNLAFPYFRVRYPLPKEDTTSLMRTLVTPSPLDVCAISPDGSQIASISVDGTLLIWDIDTGKKRQRLECDPDIYEACAINHNNTQLVTFSKGGRIAVWDIDTGEMQQNLDISPYGDFIVVKACAISLDGNKIFIVTFDGTIIIGNLRTGMIEQVFQLLRSLATACTISSDGTQTTILSIDGSIKIWNTSTGEFLRKVDTHIKNVVPQTVSLDGSKFTSVSPDGLITIWDTITGRILQQLVGHSSDVIYSTFMNNNTYLVSASLDKTVKIWDIASKEEEDLSIKYSKELRFCSISFDRTQLLSIHTDGTIQIRDVDTGHMQYLLSNKPGSVRSCAITPDKNKLISVSPKGKITVHNMYSEEEQEISIDVSLVLHVVISPDCTWVALDRGKGIIEIRSTDTGKLIQVLEDPPKQVGEIMKHYIVDFNSTLFASASWDGAVKIWNTHTGKMLQAFECEDCQWTSCAFSTDSTLLAATSRDGTIKIWDISTGKAIQTIKSPNYSWISCAFSPEGVWLTASSSEGSLKIWEISSGTCIAAFYANGPLKWCTFCISKNSLVAASNRGFYLLDLIEK